MITTGVARRSDPTDFIDKFGAVRKCVTALGAQAYGTIDIGSMQAKLLRHIGKQSPISQAELARATASDPTLTGRVLANLIERGWALRARIQEMSGGEADSGFVGASGQMPASFSWSACRSSGCIRARWRFLCCSEQPSAVPDQAGASGRSAWKIRLVEGSFCRS